MRLGERDHRGASGKVLAAVHAACGPQKARCPDCRRDPTGQRRITWGCDALANEPVWASTCPECLRFDLECPRCGGSGEIVHYRCPSALTDSEGRAAASLASYATVGVLPAPGGYGAQRARGAQLINLAAMETRLIREAQDK